MVLITIIILTCNINFTASGLSWYKTFALREKSKIIKITLAHVLLLMIMRFTFVWF